MKLLKNYPDTKGLLRPSVLKTAQITAPPPKLTVSQWADAERKLSQEASSEPGQWRTDRAPYQREMMDAVNDPKVHTVVMMTSSQIGKSEVILSIIGYHIAHDPCPMLLFQPTLELAQSFSKDRIAPMIRDTESLRIRVKDAKAKTSGNTLLHKKFPAGQLVIAGANSPASLAGRPVRIVLCDEVDRYPLSAGGSKGEGDPISLASRRTTNFYNRKLILVSTPTIKGGSRIELAFEESDQRRYHITCPTCRHSQTLKFIQLKWDNDDPSTSRYLCENCQSIIDESKKTSLLMSGKWISGKESNGIAGFHINEIYSPWRRWSQMVADFLSAKRSVETLKTWVNTSCGESWQERGDAPEWKRLYERREPYQINTIPDGVVFLTAGADIQQDRIEVLITGWCEDKQSYAIDYRVFPGDTSTDLPWKKLDELLTSYWTLPNGVSIGISMLAVDSGFNTQKVYSWVRKHPMDRVMAVKGQDNSSFILGQPKAVDINYGGRKISNGLKIWPVGTNTIKSELYGWLRLDKPIGNEPYPSGYCHFPEFGEELFKQLTAEQVVSRVVKGYRKFQWEKTRDRNEVLDTFVYARAAAAQVGLDRMTKEQWQVMRENLGHSVSRKEPPRKDSHSDWLEEMPEDWLSSRRSSWF